MDEFDLQLQDALARRKAGQQAAYSFEMPQGQMVGGHYIRPSLGNALVQGLRMYAGQKDAEKADQQIKDLYVQRTEGTNKALAEFLRQSQGTPENAPADGMGPVMPAQAPNMQGAYSALLNAPDSALRQMGMQGIAQIPEQQARAADRQAELEFRKQSAEAQRQQRMQEIQLQHQQRMEYLQQNNADRAAMAAEQRAFQAAQNEANRAFQSSIAGAVGGQKAPAGYRFKEDGTLEAIPGGPAANKDGQKPLTESQAKGSLYLGQMRSATAELGKLPSASPVSTAAAGNTFTNWATPANAQKVAQLQNQWAEAYLRAKTGAAATQGEVDLNKRTFFPVVGDSAAVIQQKAKMREQAERDMMPVAGPGAATAGGTPGGSPKRLRFDAQGNVIQ